MSSMGHLSVIFTAYLIHLHLRRSQTQITVYNTFKIFSPEAVIREQKLSYSQKHEHALYVGLLYNTKTFYVWETIVSRTECITVKFCLIILTPTLGY